MTGKARAVVLVVAAVVATWLGAQAIDREVAVDTAQSAAVQQAAPLARVCAQDPAAAAAAGADCPAAVAVARDGVNGERGEVGPAGVGVLGTRIVDGRLLVAYSDGREQDVGPVVGKDGEQGPEGRGIAGTTVTAAGRLSVAYTDGTTLDLGPVVGRDGRGIASFDQAGGRLIVVLTDGSRVDAGPLPPGPAGKDGEDGERGADGAPAPVVQSVTRNYEDGSSERCVRDGGTDVDPVQTCTRTPPPGGTGGLIDAG